jgi:hypothetical protein
MCKSFFEKKRTEIFLSSSILFMHRLEVGGLILPGSGKAAGPKSGPELQVTSLRSRMKENTATCGEWRR